MCERRIKTITGKREGQTFLPANSGKRGQSRLKTAKRQNGGTSASGRTWGVRLNGNNGLPHHYLHDKDAQSKDGQGGRGAMSDKENEQVPTLKKLKTEERDNADGGGLEDKKSRTPPW